MKIGVKYYSVIIIIGLVVIVFYKSIGQSCQLPQNMWFKTQGEVDSFPFLYPDCTDIEGWIYLSDSGVDPIVNLNGLRGIKTISEGLIILNTQLKHLYGLDSLESVGYLIIRDNDSLLNLAGLEKLSSIKNFVFRVLSNSQLQDLDNLKSLTRIGEDLEIRGNPKLKSIKGLSSITLVGGRVQIAFNDKLESLSGLEKVISFRDYVFIGYNNSITDLSGLDNLSHINSNLILASNSNLTSLEGLESLQSINGWLWISNNDKLENLDGLENLTKINGNLRIWGNENLHNINGISNINPISIRTHYPEYFEDLGIFNNSNLSVCNVISVCKVLEYPNKKKMIVNNNEGCLNENEIQQRCTVGVQNEINNAEVRLYPNPSTGSLTLELPIEYQSTDIKIYNIQGQLIWSKTDVESARTSIDLDAENGTYIMKITPKEGEVTFHKFTVIK